MRSPWVGSLALLAPARGFLAHYSAGGVRSGGSAMMQGFVRPTAGCVRAVSDGAGRWQHHAVRLRHRPRVPTGCAVRMKGSGGGGAAGGGSGGVGAKPKKEKKPDSYYKHTVILPQTEFQQVTDCSNHVLQHIPTCLLR